MAQSEIGVEPWFSSGGAEIWTNILDRLRSCHIFTGRKALSPQEKVLLAQIEAELYFNIYID